MFVQKSTRGEGGGVKSPMYVLIGGGVLLISTYFMNEQLQKYYKKNHMILITDIKCPLQSFSRPPQAFSRPLYSFSRPP